MEQSTGSSLPHVCWAVVAGPPFADIEFGEVGTVVSLLSLSTFFVKKALEQGQRRLSHVHKLGFVLLKKKN